MRLTAIENRYTAVGGEPKRTMLGKVMPLDNKHDQRVELLMSVYKP